MREISKEYNSELSSIVSKKWKPDRLKLFNLGKPGVHLTMILF